MMTRTVTHQNGTKRASVRENGMSGSVLTDAIRVWDPFQYVKNQASCEEINGMIAAWQDQPVGYPFDRE